MSPGISPPTRTRMWESMLDAHCNHLYWGALVRRYGNFDKYSRIFLAATSASAVAAWAVLVDADALWKALSALSALVAIALPIINLQTAIEKATSLTVKWFRQMRDYEGLWAQGQSPDQEDSQILPLLDQVSSREVDWKREEIGLPDDQKLLSKCHDRVLEARGLKG